MRNLEYSGQFKRDVKQAQKRGKDIDKLKVLLSLLIVKRTNLSPEKTTKITQP